MNQNKQKKYLFIFRGKYGNENVVMSDVVKAPNDIADTGKYKKDNKSFFIVINLERKLTL